MKKFFATVLIINALIWFGLSSIAKSDDKNSAIVGHIITQVIQGNDMDHAEVLSNGVSCSNAPNGQLDLTTVLLQYMPSILDSISAELRQEIGQTI